MVRRPVPADLCDEEYPPLDGFYQNRSYGRKLGLQEVQGYWKKTIGLIRSGKAPSDIGLYVHWPYCADRCAYCYCDSAAFGGEAQAERYLKIVENELESFASVLRGAELSRVGVGGGTPTTASIGQLERLMAAIHSNFAVNSGADVFVEASPNTVTPVKAKALSRAGVRRVDLGVDSLDPEVLGKSGRKQDRHCVEKACSAIRSAGLKFEAGLMFGLEGQTAPSFLKDLKWLVGLRPDTIRLYGFDPRPQTAFSQAGKTPPADMKTKTLAVFTLADRFVRKAGYRSPRRGWKVPSSVLGTGWSAKSHAFGAGWYQHPPLSEAGSGGEGAPPFFGAPLSLAEEMTGNVVRGLATLGKVSRSDFRSVFGRDLPKSGPLSAALRRLASEGAVRLDGEEVALLAGDAVSRKAAVRRLYSERARRDLRRRHGARAKELLAGRAGRGSPDCRVYQFDVQPGRAIAPHRLGKFVAARRGKAAR